MRRQRSAQGFIITADDFGLAQEVNEAVEEAHRTGALTAASLMVSGAAASDAVRRARRLSTLKVGLHLVLVDGAPASKPQDIPDLLDRNSRLRLDLAKLGLQIAIRPSLARQISREIQAQFELFRLTGLSLDHVNAHKHFHLHPFVASEIMRIGAAYGASAIRIPVESWRTLAKVGGLRPTSGDVLLRPWLWLLRRRARRASMAFPDAVFGLRWSGAMNTGRLISLIEHAPTGMIEIYLHPAVTNDFPGCCAGYDYRGEFDALCDPRVKSALLARRRTIGGYADILAQHPG